MLAKITGLFRLTRDLELIKTDAGISIAKLGLVNSEKYKGKETTLFIDAVAFSKPAEILHQYAGKKGNQIYLTGKLHTDPWVDSNPKCPEAIENRLVYCRGCKWRHELLQNVRLPGDLRFRELSEICHLTEVGEETERTKGGHRCWCLS